MAAIFYARIKLPDGIWIALKAPYGFTKKIVETIQDVDRSNLGLSLWIFRDGLENDLRAIFLGYPWERSPEIGNLALAKGAAAHVKSKPTARSVMAPLSEREAAFRTLYLLPEAPLEVAKASFRALTLILHEDTGGSKEEMQKLNLAWSVVQVVAKPFDR